MTAFTRSNSAVPKSVFVELSRRTAMLDAVGYAATRLIAGDDWGAGVRDLLARLGKATDVSRVTLFEVHRDAYGRLAQSCRFDWAEPGLQPISGDPRYVAMSLSDDDSGTLGDWSIRRMRGEVVQAIYREVSGYTKQVFEEHGTLSFASVPIILAGGDWWGFLGFDDCHLERVWTPLEIDVLRTAAALISGAIDRERAGKKLRLSEERYALASRATADGLWDWDLVAGTAYYSPRLHQVLGRRRGELGSDFNALYAAFHPDDSAEFRSRFERALARHRHKVEMETRIGRPNGEQRWISVRALIVYAAQQPVRVVGSIHDITDRKTSEVKLRHSEARIRTVLDTAGDAIISMDATGTIVEFNRAAERILGHRRGEVLGKSMAPLLIPPAQRDAHFRGIRRYLESGQSTVLGRIIEVETLRADGSTVPVELTISETKMADERLFTAFMRDITERRRFQAQLNDAERRRANLARYFSPKMVDLLMQRERSLDAVTLPRVAVLFADMIGFVSISRFAPGEETIALLREFNALIEQAVFEHEGSLDKYMGDGLMATFGTPEPGARDATNAVGCARAMAAAVVAWSRRRQAMNLPVIQIGIGLHCGEVTLGDIGSERRPEFTAVGDTVNLASRIQDLTRELGVGILASEEIIASVRQESAEALLDGFRDFGLCGVRGHRDRVRIWGRTADDLAAT
jgi:PAS domain S-box-containing protein